MTDYRTLLKVPTSMLLSVHRSIRCCGLVRANIEESFHSVFDSLPDLEDIIPMYQTLILTRKRFVAW